MIYRELHCQVIIKDALAVIRVEIRESSKESWRGQQFIIITILAPMVRNLEETKCVISSKILVYHLLNQIPYEAFVCRSITSV